MSFVRKSLIVIFSLLSFVPVYSRNAKESITLLNQLKDAVSSFGTTRITFDFVARDSQGEILLEQSGTFLAQGDSFKMSTDMIDIFCDGSSKWILDKQMMEMTIFPHDKSDNDITENPFGVIRDLNLSEYKLPKKSECVVIDSEVVQVVELIPKEKDPNYTSIVISISDKTSLPEAIEYFSRNGDSYFVKIKTFIPTEKKSPDFFVPGELLLSNPELYITDLR